MRVLEYRFSDDINTLNHWTPVFVQIGSNIRGRKFQRDSIVFELDELERALVEPEKFQQWLTLLHTCFYETPSSS